MLISRKSATLTVTIIPVTLAVGVETRGRGGHEKALGAEHVRTLASVNNLAVNLGKQGSWRTANANFGVQYKHCEKASSLRKPKGLQLYKHSTKGQGGGHRGKEVLGGRRP